MITHYDINHHEFETATTFRREKRDNGKFEYFLYTHRSSDFDRNERNKMLKIRNVDKIQTNTCKCENCCENTSLRLISSVLFVASKNGRRRQTFSAMLKA